MGGNKTRDGIVISKLEKVLSNVPGIQLRDGHSHITVATYAGLRPCPIATSTDVKKMVVPWLKETGYFGELSSKELYDGLRSGSLDQKYA